MPRLYVYVFGGFALLVIASTVLFAMLRPGPTGTTSTWEAASGLFPVGESESLQRTNETTYAGQGVELNGVVPLPTPATGSEVSFDDLKDLLSSLIKPAAPSASSNEIFTPSSYSFIPQGIIATSVERPRTPEQQVLHEYGNSLGLTLTAFADLHANMVTVLRDQAEDRANAAKSAAMKRLAEDFTRLGEDIATIEAPAESLTVHTNLANAYKDVGAKMKLIVDAQGDDAFLAAINTYNTSSETLSARLIAMIDLFQARGVTFSPTDAGSIFTFSAEASF